MRQPGLRDDQRPGQRRRPLRGQQHSQQHRDPHPETPACHALHPFMPVSRRCLPIQRQAGPVSSPIAEKEGQGQKVTGLPAPCKSVPLHARYSFPH